MIVGRTVHFANFLIFDKTFWFSVREEDVCCLTCTWLYLDQS